MSWYLMLPSLAIFAMHWYSALFVPLFCGSFGEAQVSLSPTSISSMCILISGEGRLALTRDDTLQAPTVHACE